MATVPLPYRRFDTYCPHSGGRFVACVQVVLVDGQLDAYDRMH